MTEAMRAISQRVVGGPEVLEPVEVDRPVPGPDEVLVRVRATSVNPLDWKVRSGESRLLGDPPFILGVDLSGVVERVGSAVRRFRPGDEVFGMPDLLNKPSTYAEYVAAKADDLAVKPTTMDHPHAAALPAVGLTAWQALAGIAKVHSGQRVLIHGAAGGVGHVAVQIAKAHGAYVLGTARAAKHDFLRGLGADEPIDYTVRDFTEVARDVDVVFDLIGGDYGARSLDILAPNGLLVTAIWTNPGVTAEQAESRGLRFATVSVASSGADLEQLARLVDEGRLTVHVEQTLPLEQAGRAHELSETGRVKGKIALTIG
jgi:NADPH:quinone reductase-like Zn-dependent oxidoreductase